MNYMISGVVAVALGLALSVAFAAMSLSPGDRGLLLEELVEHGHELPEVAWDQIVRQFYHHVGQAQARRDIASGKLAIRVHGLRSPEFDQAWTSELAKLGVELDYFAGCVIDTRTQALMIGYNQVVEATVSQRVGATALRLAYATARDRRRGS